jgi:hypothetical protein
MLTLFLKWLFRFLCTTFAPIQTSFGLEGQGLTRAKKGTLGAAGGFSSDR